MVVALAAMLMLSSYPLGSGPATAAPASSFEVQAPPRVEVGEPIDFRMRVMGSENLAAFEATVLFDTSVAEFHGLEVRENDLRKLERDVIPLAAVDTPYGAVVGLATCEVADCVKPDERRRPNGGGGNVTVGTASIVANAAGTYEVRFASIKAVDADGNATVLPDQTVTIEVVDPESRERPPHYAAPSSPWTLPASGPAAADRTADLAPDGVIAHADAMEVAMEWTLSRETGAACQVSMPEFDINADGCIDVADLQLIGALVGDVAPPRDEPENPRDPEPTATEEPEATEPEATATSGRDRDEPEPTETSEPEATETPEPEPTEPTEPEATETPDDPGMDLDSHGSYTFVVNVTGDGADTNPGDGVCRTAANNCSLRAAIQEANHHVGPDTITFNIPGGGTQTIKPNSQLPALWGGSTTIDGYTQPGASANTSQLANNAQIRIQLEGKGEQTFPGLRITSAGNVVRGLAIYKFNKAIWIYGNNADFNTIAGNFIGTNAAGTYASPHIPNGQSHGVHMEQGASGNNIGLPQLAGRNVITGNAQHGVGLWHGGTNDNRIRNNLVGLNPAGTVCLGNNMQGIDVNYGASNNIVGGTGQFERNVSTGNGNAAIDFSHGTNTTGNQAIGNYLGTNVNGKGMPAGCDNNERGMRIKDGVRNNVVRNNVIGHNTHAGIEIQSPPTINNDNVTTNNTIRDNWIGVAQDGTPIPNPMGIILNGKHNTIGPNNVIAHNQNDGLWLQYWVSDFNTITRNSIYNNGNLGIDLAPNGVNQNDQGDGDTGPNETLNFPVLQSATTSSVSGTACGGCTIEVFIADVKSNAFGEGRQFVGAGTASGNGSFTVSISGVAAGDYVTATATDGNGNTSEFSRNIAVGGGGGGATQLPGRIQAENYGPGGQGTDYHDTTNGNSGGACRTDNVDLATTSDSGGGCNVGWIAPGEWLRYQVNVTSSKSFTFVARVATPNSGKRFRVEVDGQVVGGSVTVPNTGGWQNWQNVFIGSRTLSAGQHTVRFIAETDGFNLNWIDAT